MLKLILLVLSTLLVSPAWTCRSQSPSDEDKNFLIEDPVEGSDYDYDYSHSAIETRGTDPVIICRIEVLTTKGFRKRCVSKIHSNIKGNWDNLLYFSAKRPFTISNRRIVVEAVKVFGNCSWELKDRRGRRIEVIRNGEEKAINKAVHRGIILI